MTSKILTVSEVESNGVSMSNVKICKEIRRLAQLDRLMVDDSVHRSGLNLHLLSYLKYCDLDVETYIKGYLMNLQPFMLQRFKEQEPDKSFICVLDCMYRISVYIKINKTFGEEIVVSFHENNKRGIAKENNMLVNTGVHYVPVFADEVRSRVEGSAREEIKILIQRGIMTVPVLIMGQLCENGTYIVNERDIETPVIDQCNQYLRDLYTSDLDLAALDNVEIFSVLHQISFTSYGNNVFSNISLLIDNLAIQKSLIGKRAADFALITYTDHLILNNDQISELCSLIDEKYKVRSQKDINVILDRVKDSLNAHSSAIDSPKPIMFD